MLTGESPGGQLKPFWVQLNATSISFASISTGIAPREVTQSAIVIAPALWAGLVTSRGSSLTPVEVSQ